MWSLASWILLSSVSLVPGTAAAQQEVTPKPELSPSSGCPAEVSVRYDVSSIAGADGILWELRRGAAGSAASWDTAEPVDRGATSGAASTLRLDLRSFGAVLEGSSYLFRARASQTPARGNVQPRPAARWSEPVAYDPPSSSPDGMYAPRLETASDGQARVVLRWSLGGEVAACADRVHYEVKKGSAFPSGDGPDPAAEGGSFGGTRGEESVPLSEGPGDYHVRLVARYGGDRSDNDVGAWGKAVRVSVAGRPAPAAVGPSPRESAPQEPAPQEPAPQEPAPQEPATTNEPPPEEPPPTDEGPTTAQKPPMPAVQMQAGSQCPADAGLSYDVSSLTGADGIRWELRRGAPGSTPTWQSAEPLDEGRRSGAAGSQSLSLRAYGATLDGTPYLARVRATASGRDIGEWSDPSAAYRPNHSPDEMYRASPETGADGSPAIRLEWSLVSRLTSCADRVHYELKKDASFDSRSGPDPAARSGSFPGTTGSRLLPLPEGTGAYYVRLVARYGGDTAENDVGRVGKAVPVRVPEPAAAEPSPAVQPPEEEPLITTDPPPPAQPQEEEPPITTAPPSAPEPQEEEPLVTVDPSPPPAPPAEEPVILPATDCEALDPSLAPSPAMFSATPVLQGTPPQYRLRIDWSLTGDLAACADRITYELMKGQDFASSALDPMTYMAQTLSGTSGSYSAFLPEGADDYWVRILARRGGDSRDHDVGLRSPAKQVTVSATRHEVAIQVIDRAASSCATSTVVAPGATVRLIAPDGSRQSAVADAEGIARLSVLGGSYTLTATHAGCGTVSEPLTVNAARETSVTLPGCGSDEGDLMVLVSSPSTDPTGGEPYPLAVTVRNVGTGSSERATLSVAYSEGPYTTWFYDQDIQPLCPGGERTFTVHHQTPEPGKTYRYTAGVIPEDAEPGNNSAYRTVAFPADEPPVSAEAVVINPIVAVSISSFAIRGGLPRVTPGRSVTLDATASGSPTEYRAAETTGTCPQTLSGSTWRPWSASSPPTWSFSSAGRKRVCFQLRTQTDDSGGVSAIAEDEIFVVEPTWTSSVSDGLGNTDFDPVAGSAEPRGALDCGDGFAVGVDTRSALYVDAIALRCADLGPNGEHRGAWTTPFVGGPGGTRQNLRCTSGEVVVGLSVYYGWYLDALYVTCAPWRSDSGAANVDNTSLGPVGVYIKVPRPTPSGDVVCGGGRALKSLPSTYTRGSYVGAFHMHCTVPEGL